ncbi:hypothetical protein [Streptomyces sp. NPDC060035]|uniref:hypothetical protein n=1 Tax=Streptomyces sp. NPDC060035 TaxID=3347044 RepID=UPI00367419C9
MQSTDFLLSKLAHHMDTLATVSRVYIRVGRFTDVAPSTAELAEQVHGLLVQIFEDVAWKRFFTSHEPMPALNIEASLEPIEINEAAAFMAIAATVDIVWPPHRLMDDAGALHTAKRVVSLLGADAAWWTNHDSYCGATNLVTPVFDSLIAGMNGHVFAMLIQVADD